MVVRGEKRESSTLAEAKPVVRIPHESLSVAEPVRRTAPDPLAPRLVVQDSSPVAVAPSTTQVPLSTPATTSLGAASTSGPASLPVSSSEKSSASTSLQDGIRADDLRLYRTSLAMAARRFKRYPSLAREHGWEGTAEVAFSVTAASPVPVVKLLKSSSRPILDEQAVAMITQAAQVTSLPEGLKGKAFRIILPVEFSLEE